MFKELSEKSWTVQNDWLSKSEVHNLRKWGEKARLEGLFHPAGIGREAARNQNIRGDQILWIEPTLPEPVAGIWQKFEKLRQGLNQEMFLGLDHFEIHLAVYPPGKGYDAHIDQARGKSSISGERVISFVLYLNENWTPQDQGELMILNAENRKTEFTISPEAGRLLLFRSDTILHEVRPPRRERWSLTGWFRRR